MFAIEENVIPYFETVTSVDQGSDVNPYVKAVERIAKKAMQDNFFTVDDEEEAAILRGAQFNLDLDAEDFYMVYCADLNQVELSVHGKEALIDYLADKVKEKFWFALREIEAQKKKNKRKRRAR